MASMTRNSKGQFVAKIAEAPVETSTETESTKRIIEIISAKYGIKGNMIEVAKVKIGRKASNRMAGADPAPKEAKVMIIKAKVNGEIVTKTFNEGEKVEF